MRTDFDALDSAIDTVLNNLANVEPETDKYSKMADQLTKLIKAKEILGNLRLKEFDAHTRMDEANESFSLKKREIDLKEKESEKPDKVSKETLALIASNIAGIVLIIGYERMNVIASKALSFVMKTR